MNTTAVLGLIIGIGGILLGNAIEGGHFGSLLQGAAFLIVTLGTLGATVLSHKSTDLKRSWQLLKSIFTKEDEKSYEIATEEIVECARIARKDTLLALESKTNDLSDRFLAEVVTALVDGTDAEVIEDIFREKIFREEQQLLAGAKVWTDAGGFSPTIGIIGAVLGLIHVMSNISDTSKLGTGIAVAFVATIYGVGFANLILIPVGNRLKRAAADKIRFREMILAGGLAIQKGLNPTLIQIKLNSFQER